MKKCFLLMPFLLICFLQNVKAQTKKEKAVIDRVNELRKAMIDGDSLLLDNLAADQLSYGHSGGVVENKQEFIHKLTSGKSDFVTMDISEQTVSITNHTAIVRHKLDATINDNGKPGEVHLQVMLVWIKQHGDWKLLARQAVKQPVKS